MDEVHQNNLIQMATLPIVSIGMPVYNGEKYVREALDSLLAQSFTDFELIISDNASVDNTAAICQEYAASDSRIRYVRQPENLGALFNFQFVRNEACGEYFMWAAHDDLWDKDWIDRLLGNYGNKTAISFGHVVNIDENRIITKTYPCSRFSGNKLMRLMRFYLTEDMRGKPNLIYGLYKTAMLKKLDFKEYGNSQYGQDMHFIFNCLQHGEITTDHTTLLYKRVEKIGKRKLSPYAILSSIFLVNRIRSYLAYSLIVPVPREKIILAVLFPIKYLASFIYNFATQISRRFLTNRLAKRI